MTQNSESIRKTLFSYEGIIIAASPILAYLYTFRYESAFASMFKIPLRLIELNLTTFFVMVGTLAVVFFIVISFYNLIYQFIAVPFKKEEVIYGRIISLTPLFFMFAADVYLFGWLWRFWVASLFVMFLVAFFFFLFPLISQRSKGSYLEKLRADDEYDAEHAQGLIVTLARSVGYKHWYYFFWLYVIFCIAGSAGKAKAVKENEFFVLASSPNTVVLRIYGDRIICAPFNREDRKVERSLVIYRTDANLPLKLMLEEVGPLSLRPIEEDKKQSLTKGAMG